MSDTITTNITLPMNAIHAYCEKWGVVEFALFGSVLRDDFILPRTIQSLGISGTVLIDSF